MPATCVVGLQWGDEAKGKITDILSADHDAVVRYNGGANAGHTIVWGSRTFRLSLLPTGVLNPAVKSVIGNGVVVYPPRFIEEVASLESAGIPVGANLTISSHAHLIFPYHMEEERVVEGASDGGALGTTGRGIGPCYQDKVGRRFAIRVGEMLDADHFRRRLEFVVPYKNRLISALAGTGGVEPKRFDAAKLADEYLGYAEAMRPHVADTAKLLHDSLDAGKRLLFEAAQGSLLDVDHGTYPYVTSSSSLPSGIWGGSGVCSREVSRIIGVVKAYTTRVGRGPFPTELADETGERIRKIGREYGTVTGRPRRCGWFDAVAVRYSARLAGADEITVMLLDVLAGLPELKLATAYTLKGERVTHFPSDAYKLDDCTPEYETMPGFSEDVSGCRNFAELPHAAQNYVRRIEELVGKPVSVVSVGPDRAQTIRLK